ncbi:MAG TPA: glycosyltransferase family 9 protein [Opitutaceae bacterium]|jgi:ADP-heptose:LPS heptosyltransferase
MASSSGLAPQSVVLLRPDGMGDLILFEPVLRTLRQAWPDACVTVVVQAGLVGLGRLLVPGVRWEGIRIDPFRAGPDHDVGEVERMRDWVRSVSPDLLIACTARRSWLEGALGSAVPKARRVAFGEGGEDPYFGPLLRALFGNDAARVDAVASAADGDEDWRRSFGLLSEFGLEAAPTKPALPGRDAWMGKADARLKEWGWQPGRYVVCAAAGFANVPLKTWPRDRFVDSVRQANCGPVVFVGSSTERDYLAPMAAELNGQVWTSSHEDWPALVSLLAQAAVCVGNDTGLLHLAAAAGTPVAALFGGGTWPRFVPAGPGVALHNPLPCFGCGWDCAFGDAPCVKVIPSEDMAVAIRDAAASRGAPICERRAVNHVGSDAQARMGAAARLFRERGELLRIREKRFQETVRLAGEKDGEIVALKKETDGKDAEISLLKQETNNKDIEITGLKRETNGKDVEIDNLKRQTDLKDEEIRRLKAIADERLELIKRLDEACREKERANQRTE